MQDSVLRRDTDFGNSNTVKRCRLTLDSLACEHYNRRCKIRAPCCDQIFPCRRHCHNETAISLAEPKEWHELVRQDVKQVVCLVCKTEQEFHCDDCGICRLVNKSVGGRENFFHCQNCGACYALRLRDKHSCVENSTKSSCPVCMRSCSPRYRCPICSRSMLDMTSASQILDMEIRASETPDEYKFEVSILCNDCNKRSREMFHILGHKCQHCGSYTPVGFQRQRVNLKATDSRTG